MPQGKLGSATLMANTDTLLFTASEVQAFNVRFANRNWVAVKVRVAIGTGASPVDADWITFDASIPANGILEETGIVVSAGEKIFVRSDTVGVSVRAHGY